MRKARRLLGPLLLFVAWVAGCETGVIPARILPGPGTVAATAQHMLADGELLSALWVSLGRVAAGLSLGVLAGTLLALVSGLTRLGDDLIDAPLQMLRTMPVLALVPLFIVWFGIGEAPKIYLIGLASMFPVYLNLSAGIRATDPKLVEAANTLGLSRAGVIRHVVLPGATGSWLVGIRYAAGISWLVLVVSEQINATNGIGALMTNAENFLDTPTIVVCLVVYGLLGLLTDAAVRLGERIPLRWR